MVAMRRRRSSHHGRSVGGPKNGTSPDLTVLAVPFYFATMAGEYLWLKRRAAKHGPTPGDYERRDTLASLAMGVGSLVAPLVAPKLLRPFTLGRGRYGKALVVGALGAAAVTTVADIVVRRIDDGTGALDRGPGDRGPGDRGPGVASLPSSTLSSTTVPSTPAMSVAAVNGSVPDAPRAEPGVARD